MLKACCNTNARYKCNDASRKMVVYGMLCVSSVKDLCETILTFGSDIGRTISSATYTNTTGMTNEACISFCDKQNYLYAGTEYAQEVSVLVGISDLLLIMWSAIVVAQYLLKQQMHLLQTVQQHVPAILEIRQKSAEEIVDSACSTAASKLHRPQ